MQGREIPAAHLRRMPLRHGSSRCCPAGGTLRGPVPSPGSTTVHGEAIDRWPLLDQVLRAFMDADREFRAWRRQAGEAAAEPGSRSGRGSRNA